MKGFFIEVTNNLLEEKHREAMGDSVWLFMWFLDKMTSVNEEGIGKVLGGKPIRYADVNEDFPMPERTYKRYLSRLKEFAYINTLRASRGLVITVNKAKKRFGQRYAKSGTSPAESGTSIGYAKSGTSNIRQDSIDNKQVDNVAAHGATGKEINDLIDLFKPVNPNHEMLFRNKSQRSALERMVKKHGIEKIRWAIEHLPKTNKERFAPTITTPYQLEMKLGDLISFFQKKKAEHDKNKIVSL